MPAVFLDGVSQNTGSTQGDVSETVDGGAPECWRAQCHVMRTCPPLLSTVLMIPSRAFSLVLVWFNNLHAPSEQRVGSQKKLEHNTFFLFFYFFYFYRSFNLIPCKLEIYLFPKGIHLDRTDLNTI